MIPDLKLSVESDKSHADIPTPKANAQNGHFASKLLILESKIKDI